jgi:hypothetical protein
MPAAHNCFGAAARPMRTTGSRPMAVWQRTMPTRLHAARAQAQRRSSTASGARGGSYCAAPGSGGLRRWQIWHAVMMTTMTASASAGHHGAHQL